MPEQRCSKPHFLDLIGDRAQHVTGLELLKLIHELIESACQRLQYATRTCALTQTVAQFVEFGISRIQPLRWLEIIKLVAQLLERLFLSLLLVQYPSG